MGKLEEAKVAVARRHLPEVWLVTGGGLTRAKRAENPLSHWQAPSRQCSSRGPSVNVQGARSFNGDLRVERCEGHTDHLSHWQASSRQCSGRRPSRPHVPRARSFNGDLRAWNVAGRLWSLPPTTQMACLLPRHAVAEELLEETL